MREKEFYEPPKIVINEFLSADIITASLTDEKDNGGDIPESWG